MNKKNVTETYIPLAVIIFVFGFFFFFDNSAPGIYYDAINPDYQAVKILSGDTQYINHFQPWSQFPILGQLYHGVLHTYVAIPFFYLLGTNIISLRLAQGLFAFLILIFVHALLKRQTNSLIAFIFTLLLATDPVLNYAFKTQGYITLSPLAFVLVAIWLIINNDLKIADLLRFFLAGLFAGLAVYGYFFYFFFIPTFLVFIFLRQRKIEHVLWFLSGCFVGGGLLYLYGYAQIILAVGFDRFILDYGVANSNSPPSFNEVANRLGAILFSAVNGGYLYWIIFSERLTVELNSLKIFFMLATLSFSLFLTRKGRGFTFFIVSLILSFCFFSLFMKGRIASHHSLFLLPLLYLLVGVSFFQILDLFNSWIIQYRAFSIVCFVLALVGVVFYLFVNLFYQNVFYEKLKHTGGVHYYSNSLGVLSADAVLNRQKRHYVFPDWGFSLPFIFYTEAKVKFSQSFDIADVKANLCTKDVAIVTWYELREKISTRLSESNLKYDIVEFQQQDGAPSVIMYFLIQTANRLDGCKI